MPGSSGCGAFSKCRMPLLMVIKLRFPGKEPDELDESCALDAAEEGGMTLSAIGQRLNLTRERIRQIERIALRKLADVGLDLEEFLQD